MVGGYKLIDLKNKPFTSGQGETIKGIHNEIVNTKKEIRLINVVVNNESYPSLTANFDRKSPCRALVPAGETPLLIEVTTDDVITISAQA